MKSNRKFPKEIYLTLEEEGSRAEYFQVHVAPDTAAEIGSKQRVGKYLLDNVVSVETKILVSENKT